MAIFKTENLSLLGADPAAARPSVMIVDDMDANVSVMATILRPHFDVIEAHDGQEALRLIEALSPAQTLSCIISDHRMPGMSGVQLFERVLRLLPHTRRILVTGYLDIDAIIDAVNKAQIYRFVAKPFDAGDFLLTVRCAVASHAASAQRHACHAAMAALCADVPPQLQAMLEQADGAAAELARLEAQWQAVRSGDSVG
jgi:response regulator RpfG family c-di-GMP phosphodiesterase